MGKVVTKRNWTEYEEKAVLRGNLMLYISPEIAKTWYPDPNAPKKAGGQQIYTDRCIEDLMRLKYLLGLGYRALEGFATGLLIISGLGHLRAPDRSTIDKRSITKPARLPRLSNPKAGYVVSLDSTGLKIHGQGEWNRKKHKQRDRANWVKMHIAIDNKTMQILTVESTADDVQDIEMFNNLINGLPATPGTVMGDGAYDTFGAYQKATEAGFDLIVPPKETAVITNSNNPYIIARNKHVAYYQEKGINAWANKNDYWDRNRVETTMSRFVTTFSDKLSSRTVQAQQNEIIIKCHILNIMMAGNQYAQDSAA